MTRIKAAVAPIQKKSLLKELKGLLSTLACEIKSTINVIIYFSYTWYMYMYVTWLVEGRKSQTLNYVINDKMCIYTCPCSKRCYVDHRRHLGHKWGKKCFYHFSILFIFIECYGHHYNWQRQMKKQKNEAIRCDINLYLQKRCYVGFLQCMTSCLNDFRLSHDINLEFIGINIPVCINNWSLL